MSSSPEISLSPNLEELAIAQFDELLTAGEILYEVPKLEHFTSHGFQFQFFITPVLGPKPTLSPDDPGRTKAVGPFVDPPENFIVARIGTSHKIIMNKYCIYRPMLILHTTLFAPQTDDLDAIDMAAAWAILHSFTTPQMVIYNCGVDGGSSQGHKHLQIFPVQDNEDFQMWPSGAQSTNDIISSITNVPFKHFVLCFPPKASASHVFENYRQLLQETKIALRDAGAGTDYNMILTADWIALIPRRSKGHGAFIANAANMVGLTWTRNEDMRDRVIAMGVDGLAQLGIPVNRNDDFAKLPK